MVSLSGAEQTVTHVYAFNELVDNPYISHYKDNNLTSVRPKKAIERLRFAILK